MVMKYIISILIFSLLACDTLDEGINQDIPALSNHSYQKIKTHELGLNYYFEGYLQTEIDGEEYLIGIDSRNSKLDFINRRNDDKNFQLFLFNEGPDVISNDILSLTIRNSSLFVLTTNTFYIAELSIEDQNFTVKNKIELLKTQSRFTVANMTIALSPKLPFFSLDENNVYVPFFLSSYIGDKQFFEEPNFKVIDLTNYTQNDYFIEWPLPLLYVNSEFLHPLNQRFYPLKVNDEIFISYPFSSQVQKVVLEENSTRVEQGFGIQHETLDDEIITTPIRKGEKLGKHHISGYSHTASFLPLRYNHIKDRLFRIFFTAQKEEFIDKKPWIREREKILFEYSLDGKILSETMIPANLDMDPVVMKDGSYWFPVWKDVLDEDFMEFVVYR